MTPAAIPFSSRREKATDETKTISVFLLCAYELPMLLDWEPVPICRKLVRCRLAI